MAEYEGRKLRAAFKTEAKGYEVFDGKPFVVLDGPAPATTDDGDFGELIYRVKFPTWGTIVHAWEWEIFDGLEVPEWAR